MSGAPFIAFAVTFLACSAVRAEESSRPEDATAAPANESSIEAAREAFRLGAASARAGRWDVALEAFERSHRLRPHPVTSYNLGYCERAIGHATRALRAFHRALAEHARGTDGRLSARLVDLANEYANEAESRVGRVRVAARTPDARIAIDGRPLESVSTLRGAHLLLAGTREAGAAERVPAAEFEVWVDPGVHVFVLERPGAPPSIQHRLSAAASTDVVAFDVAVRPSRLPSDRRSAGPKIDRGWAYLAFGVGAAALVAGSVAGYQAIRTRAELHEVCGPNEDQCPEIRKGTIDTLHRASDFSTVAFSVAAAGVATGTLLILFGGSDERRASRAGLGVGLSGIRLKGSF